MTEIREPAGEDLLITVLVKDRDGNVPSLGGSDDCILTIARDAGGDPEIEVTGATLVDAVTGEYRISVPTATLDPAVIEGRTYYYNLWHEDPSGVRIRQAAGEFVRLRSIPPS